MRNRPTPIALVLSVILCSGLVLPGCSGRSGGPVANPMGEGFRNSLPLPGTRVMAWSNNQDAMASTRGWLQDRGMEVLEQSKVEEELKDLDVEGKSKAEQSARILEIGKTLEADLGVLVFVEDHQVGPRSNSTSPGNQSASIVLVKAWGQDVKTDEILFSGKAWNSRPMNVSDEVVVNLTEMALLNAWGGEGQTSVPPVQVVATERSGPSGSVSSEDPLTDTTKEPSSSSNPKQPEEIASKSEDPSVGLQVASGALSILYTPLKLAYAGLGGIVGGLAYVVTAGNERVAHAVWDASLKGTYWLKPSHLKGEEPIYFLGPSTIAEGGNTDQGQ